MAVVSHAWVLLCLQFRRWYVICIFDVYVLVLTILYPAVYFRKCETLHNLLHILKSRQCPQRPKVFHWKRWMPSSEKVRVILAHT